MNWWETFSDAVNQFFNGPLAFQKNPQSALQPDPLQSFLDSTAGGIARGIESGVVALLKDLWDVILGPLEIVIGAVIILVGIGLVFNNDLAAVGRMIP